jgi:hypothetical protein
MGTSHMQNLQNAGMRSIAVQNATNLQHAQNYPGVIVGWMHNDEPDNDQGGQPCIDTAVLQNLYSQWTTADSTRPVYLNLGMGVAYTQWGGAGPASTIPPCIRDISGPAI